MKNSKTDKFAYVTLFAALMALAGPGVVEKLPYNILDAWALWAFVSVVITGSVGFVIWLIMNQRRY